MPLAHFDVGSQAGSVDTAARTLIPGVEPGGSRAGRALKPALLIKDAWFTIRDLVLPAGIDLSVIEVNLKLSQETDLTPGLLLPLGTVLVNQAASSGQRMDAIVVDHTPARAVQGTLWAPRMVGVRLVEAAGDFTSFDIDVFLSYERIDIPWMDWFIAWEFLDGIVDNEREY